MSRSLCPSKLNCTSPGAWEPNSDIAGRGVLIGFVGTGYLVFLLLVVHYFVAYDPDLSPVQQVSDDERQSQATSLERLPGNIPGPPSTNVYISRDCIDLRPNLVDVNLLALVRTWVARLLIFAGASLPLASESRSKRVRHCFDMCIIAICDVQMITGMSILIGGFICLDEHLSALHWQIITYLAWFSSVTHLSGLTVLRRYFQTRPLERSLRITLMLTLLFILIVAMIPSGFFNWKSPRADSTDPQPTAALAKSPAACFFNLACGEQLYRESFRRNCTEFCYKFSNESEQQSNCLRDFPSYLDGFDCRRLGKSSALQEMVISTVLLVFGFASRAVKLSGRASSTIYRRFTLPVSNYALDCFTKLDNLVPNHERQASRRQYLDQIISDAWRHLVVRPVLATLLVVSANFELFNSMLGELSWLLAILLWGTSKVLTAYNDEQWYTREEEGEKPSTRWEFGQLLPVLLLAAPLVALLGTFTSAEMTAGANLSVGRPEVSNTVLENTSSGHRNRRHSQEDTLELTSMATRDREMAAQRQNHHEPSRTDATNIEASTNQNRRINGRNILLGNYYIETDWMPPCMTSSFMTIWTHVFFLFWFATDAFLVPGIWTYTSEGKYILETDGKVADVLVYLFQIKGGMFYLILATYPVACHSVILTGLAVDEWFETPHNTTHRTSRRLMYWIWALGINCSYVISIQYVAGVPSKGWGDGLAAILVQISFGFYALYHVVGFCVQVAAYA
ncbi:hypothetical protein CPAR01_10492 [Colletotrichum paranaense]|uniref:Integral membrane protein n=1 Tax=Colletotrichum paranaense TaxID=1914294 RepID=A0ABQ9SE66_9PEZI|nr:uncharacterized protein CPAR01_10492 [Colletotrichum paranaense]KAK1533784.1 hypothetical protein CPAR01_10492 [Colletotrichum paranaense]